MEPTYDNGQQTMACRLIRQFSHIRKTTGRGDPDAAGARKLTGMLQDLVRPSRQSECYSNPVQDRMMLYCAYADGSGLAVEISADEMGTFAGDRETMQSLVSDCAEDACLTAGDVRDLIRSVPLALAKEIRASEIASAK